MELEPNKIEFEFFSMAMEVDTCGLFELIAALNTVGSTTTLDAKFEAAQKAVHSLYGKGSIEFVEQKWVGTSWKDKPTDPENVDQLLRTRSNWCPENADGIRLCISITDAGKEAWYAQHSRL